MKDKRILYVSSEVVPIFARTTFPQCHLKHLKWLMLLAVKQEFFMPRFGNINERRHQLHEVIRLSGMNLVVNDLDMPLIMQSRFYS